MRSSAISPRERGQAAGRKGKMNACAVAVDVGGTNCKAAVVGEDGGISLRRRWPTEVPSGRSRVVERLSNEIKRLASSASKRGMKVLGAGIGMPGAMRLPEGVIHKSPNFPGWEEFGIRESLERTTAMRVVVENDANAAALGEHWLGAGKGCENFIMLTIGTGLGSGFIVDGRILHGADGMGGEAGHIVVEAEGRPCNCGGRGCLETRCSAVGIERMARESAGRGESAALTVLCRRVSFGVKEVHLLHLKGDRAATRILRTAGEFLGVALASLVNVFNPEKVAIGGGACGAWSPLVTTAVSVMRRRAYRAAALRARVVRTELAGDAGIAGAAACVLREAFF